MIKNFNYNINDGFLWSEINLKGEKKYYVEGYISTIDKDKAGEVIDYSAQEDIYKQVLGENITMDLEHEEWYDENGNMLQRPRNEKIPVAKIVDARLTGKGVWVKAEINKNLSKFNEVWGSIKDGFLKAFSIAFYPVQKAGNVIKSLNLVNVTLTGSPVNPNATFNVVMKSAGAWLKSLEESEGIKVSEEVKVEEKIEVKVEEPKELEPVKVEEKPVEVKVEEPVKIENPLSQIKAEKEALEAEIKALTKSVADLKAELAKPVMKAVISEVPKLKEEIELKINPLGLIK